MAMLVITRGYVKWGLWDDSDAMIPSFTGFSVGFASTITTSDTQSVLRIKAIRSLVESNMAGLGGSWKDLWFLGNKPK